MDIAAVPLESIALDDNTFDLGFGRRYEALRQSIAAVGVLQPLSVREAAGGRFQIVCGFGRARAARTLRLEPIPARVLPPQTSDADCLRVALFDNLAHRRFNPIERAIILAKLGRHVDRGHLLSDYMPLLGMQPSGGLLDRALLLPDLADRLKGEVSEGRIEEKVGVWLARRPAGDQEAFADLLDGCRPSVSIAREWAETLVDVARRQNEGQEGKDESPGGDDERRGIAKILASPEVAAILEADGMTDHERTAALRTHFRRLRYPTVSAWEAQFAETRAALRMPPSMRLEPAANFESSEIRLQIQFRNEGELRQSADVLAGWLDDPTILKGLWPGGSETLDDE